LPTQLTRFGMPEITSSLQFERADGSTQRLARYPTALIDIWNACEGERLMLRPVLPQDVHLLEGLIHRSSPKSRYNRFHGAVNALPPNVLCAMTAVDYRQHMALLITSTQEHNEVALADARYCVDATGRSAEFAVLVEDRWQRRGLGSRAIGALVAAARCAGILRLHGPVLRSNFAMLSLLRGCGFREVAGAQELRAVSLEKRLTL
jgi:acetyltransferase